MSSEPMFRKKRQLEIFLEKVPDFTKSDARLEQYRTPAPIAADIVFNAFTTGDIHGKHVADLGCGTGMFAVGAKVMGAAKVQGLDVDPTAIETARAFSKQNDLDIYFEELEVGHCDWRCDTVLMNPPFGAQTKRADRIFIETATRIADVVYTIHNSNTVSFIRLLADKRGYYVGFEKNYLFRLGHTFDFHRKPVVEHDVTLIQLRKKI